MCKKSKKFRGKTVDSSLINSCKTCFNVKILSWDDNRKIFGALGIAFSDLFLHPGKRMCVTPTAST